jgi:hypothetical protein
VQAIDDSDRKLRLLQRFARAPLDTTRELVSGAARDMRLTQAPVRACVCVCSVLVADGACLDRSGV